MDPYEPRIYISTFNYLVTFLLVRCERGVLDYCLASNILTKRLINQVIYTLVLKKRWIEKERLVV